MNSTNNEPPTRLLNRLKIIHSVSASSLLSNSVSQKLAKSDKSSTPNNFQLNKNNNNINTIPNFPTKHQYSSSQLISNNKINNSSISKRSLSKDNTLVDLKDSANKKSNNKNKNNSNRLTSKNNNLFKNSVSRPFSTQARFLSTPSKPVCFPFLKDISGDIKLNKIKNIVIMAGAGISCPSGIPDFRTPGSGLYDNLKQYRIPHPEAIFDIEYFQRDPKPFYVLAKELFPSGKYRPNKTHYFFKLLQDKKLLMRIYTQNIDGLERLAGVHDNYLVEAHGTFGSATCLGCRETYSGTFVKTSVDKDKIPTCIKCQGVVKPDIVFFGENMPSKFHLYNRDLPQADLLLVMGTSLEVEPFANIVNFTRLSTPRILINRDAVGVFRAKRRVNDYTLLGDIIDGVDKIVQHFGWEEDLNTLMAEGELNKIQFQDTISPSSKPLNNRRNYSTLIGRNMTNNNNSSSSKRNNLPPIYQLNSTNYFHKAGGSHQRMRPTIKPSRDSPSSSSISSTSSDKSDSSDPSSL